MKKIKTRYISVIFIIIWAVFFTTDFIRVSNQQPPVFSIVTAEADDGGSKIYSGVFYEIHKKIHDSFTENKYFTWHMRPWFSE